MHAELMAPRFDHRVKRSTGPAAQHWNQRQEMPALSFKGATGFVKNEENHLLHKVPERETELFYLIRGRGLKGMRACPPSNSVY